MLIRSRLTKQDFISLSFLLLYSKTGIKIFTALSAIIFVMCIVASISSEKDFSLPLILSFFFLIFMPLSTYINAARSFNASNRISETIEYHFEQDNLSIRGESFSSQLSWDKIYKVTQTKKWILIWQNSQVGNPVLKGDISEAQMGELKEILDHHKVKNNL